MSAREAPPFDAVAFLEHHETCVQLMRGRALRYLHGKPAKA